MTTTVTNPEEYDLVVLGSGEGGKYLAWTLARKDNASSSWSNSLRTKAARQSAVITSGFVESSVLSPKFAVSHSLSVWL